MRGVGAGGGGVTVVVAGAAAAATTDGILGIATTPSGGVGGRELGWSSGGRVVLRGIGGGSDVGRGFTPPISPDATPSFWLELRG